MGAFNDFKSTEAAVAIVVAAAQAGTLKLHGSPTNSANAEQVAETDGKYIAKLVNTIAEGITSK